jgi:hypothetical protein
MPDAGQTTVTFLVHVPENTPPGDSIYIAGNITGGDPASPGFRLSQGPSSPTRSISRSPSAPSSSTTSANMRPERQQRK